MEEESGVRTRNFRHEDYCNRRAFLRSYPLQWEREEEEEEEEESNGVDVEEIEEEEKGKGTHKGCKKGAKGMFMAVFHELGGDEGKFSQLLSKLRDKDYYNWRAFLRSYPLQWGREEDSNTNDVEVEEEEEDHKANRMPKGCKKGVKKRFMAVFHEQGEDECKFSLLLNKLRGKFGFYLIAGNAFRHHRPRLQFLKAAY